MENICPCYNPRLSNAWHAMKSKLIENNFILFIKVAREKLVFWHVKSGPTFMA